VSSHLLQLLLLLALIIALAKAGGLLSSRIKQPAVFGELLVGLILGPSVLDIFGWSIFHDPTLEVIVKDLAEIGVIMLMFIAGLETDLAEMRKVGLAATGGAMGGVIFPFSAGTGLGILFGFGLYESLFIGTVLTATSVSISAQTLMELGHLRSKEGSTILGAAIIDDVLGIIMFSAVVALGASGAAGGGGASIPLVVAHMFLFFVLSIVIGSMLLEGIVSWVEKRARASEALFAAALVVIFVYSFAAQALGRVATITGSYIAGVLFSRTSVYKQVEKQIGGLTYGFLAPIFFVSIGLEADIHLLTPSTLLFAGLVTVAAIITKQLGCAVGTLATGFNWTQSLRVGTGMVSRGEVALIVATLGFGAGVIEEDVFAVLIIMTLITTIVTPVMLRYVFRGSKAGAGVESETEEAAETVEAEGGPGTGGAGKPTPDEEAGRVGPAAAPVTPHYPSETDVLEASAENPAYEGKVGSDGEDPQPAEKDSSR